MVTFLYLISFCLAFFSLGSNSKKGHSNSLLQYNIINVSITINNKIINQTNDKFASYTIDMAQIVNNLFNLSDPQFIYLVSQLSPSILRVGGTDTDYTYYKVGNEDPCHLPQNQSHGYYCYSMEQFTELVEFANAVGSDLVFGLSMGYPLFPKSDQYIWNYTNTEEFLRFIHDVNNYTNNDIYGWELGNEVSNNPFKTAKAQGNAFVMLDKLIANIWNTSNSSYFHLFGFDNAGKTLYGDGNFTYFVDFVNITCDVLSGLTYHVYIGGNSTNEVNPDWLDKQYVISRRVSNIFTNNSYKYLCSESNLNRIRNNVIAGEIAYHSGENVESNLLNTYIDGFWYNDAFGILSSLGQSYFFRQTMADNGYGLLDLKFNPHPDYYVMLLHKNLMSSKVLSIESNQKYFRIYSHCLNTKYPMKNINNLPESIMKNAITISYLNLFSSNVAIMFNKNILMNNTRAFIWSLLPNNKTNIKSKLMLLNNVLLELDKTGKVPNLNGKEITLSRNVNDKTNVTVSSLSYGFIVFTMTNIDVCV